MIMRQDVRTLAELEKAYLSDESAAEFDRIVRRVSIRRMAVWGAIMTAAASLALILTLTFHDRGCAFDGVEIADGIEQIMSLDTGNVKSVTARPEGRRVILTVLMKDGSRCAYVMSREDGGEAFSITAMK